LATERHGSFADEPQVALAFEGSAEGPQRVALF
jgi:hypothetical protein